MPHVRSHRDNRHGMTLIEVVLVVAVLVVIASLASPSLLGMMETQKLRKSAEVMRGAFAKTRLLAMETGRIQMFRFQYDTGVYTVEPWFASDDAIESNSLQQTLPGLLPTQTMTIEPTGRPTELPEGIVFLAGETLSDNRSAEIDTALAQQLAHETVWSPPILFYPDGTTSNARIVLANKKRQVIEVTLRGITGMAQSGELLRMDMEGVVP
jgi:prepilin-type N-terminal cleavage/methylation domain-containing protein